MKVYVLIRDETDYNGERTVIGVYESEQMAKKVAILETAMAQAKADLMVVQKKDDMYKYWVPHIFVVETDYFDD